MKILRAFYGLYCLFIIIGKPAAEPGQEVHASQDDRTAYVIIITGTELLDGTYSDSHTQFLTRTFNPLGCRCEASMFVGDQRDDLRDALEYASKHAELILVTGGLGPTEDDITREVLSEYTGIELKAQPDLTDSLQRRFHQHELQDNLKPLTLTPLQGIYMPNPNGTAAGLIFEASHQVIAAMPGPPRELRPMVRNHLLPYMEKRFGIKTIGSKVRMRFVGIGESSIDKIIDEHLTLPDDLIISSLFENSRVDVTFALPGDSPKNRERLNRLKTQLLQHIGEYMYSDQGLTLEQAVMDLLKARETTLSVAEVGSGGALASSLIFSAEAGPVFQGGIIAPSDKRLIEKLGMEFSQLAQKSRRALVEQTLRHITRDSAAHWGVVVSQSIKQNDQPFVWLAVGSQADGYKTHKINLRGSGETMRDHLVSAILDKIRRQLTATSSHR